MSNYITEHINEVSPDGNSGNPVPLADLVAEMRQQRDSARAEAERLKKRNTELLLEVSKLTVKLAKAGSPPPKPPVKPKPTISEDDLQRDIDRFRSWMQHK